MDWEQKYHTLEQQFEEFQRDSKDYEHELESELKRYEHQKELAEDKNHHLLLEVTKLTV